MMEYLQKKLECGRVADEQPRLVLVAVALLLWLWVVMRRRRTEVLLLLPPSPSGAWPIVGHFPLLGKQPHIAMAALADRYGPVYSLRLGSIPAIVVSSPDLAKQVLHVQDKAWASRPTHLVQAQYFSFNHKGIAFAQYTPMWRQLRKIATLELFTAKRLAASHALREEEMQHMIRSILHDGREGKREVDVKAKLSMIVANQIFRMVLNRRLSGSGDDKQEEDQEFKDIVMEMQHLKGLFMPGDYVQWLRPLDIGGTEKRIKALQRRWDAFLDVVLREHEEKQHQQEEEKDMVDVLLHTMRTQDPKHGEESLDVDNIKATIMSMLAAGMDTSIVTTEWGMSELIRNPDVLRKLTSELDTIIGKDRMVQESDLPKLKYLQAVVKEVFRLHPPAPLLLPHESIQDSQLAGYHVPKGTRLFLHVHAMGRSSSVWENPLEFDPERFFVREPGVDVRGMDFRLLPFGSGRRACPAITLGTVSLQWTTALLVHAFHWSLPPGETDLDMTEVFGITTPRAVPLLLHATPRLKTKLYI